MRLRFFVPVILTFVLGCATGGEHVVDGIREGMDKDQVLRDAGNPRRTYRTSGQDHWIYTFFRGEQEFSRTVSFEDGKVVKIGRPVAKQNWDKEMENYEREKGNSVNKPK